MNRIYHPYWLWEDYKAGFYDNCSGELKEKYIQDVINMFNSGSLTEKYMNMVLSEWKYSCEHNLSNESLNRIAYIGQAACCIFCGAPNTVTMEAWNKLDINVQNRSDLIAEKILNKWIESNKNKQLCLNII